MLPIKSRSVTDEERAILKDALSELQGSLVCSDDLAVGMGSQRN